MEEKQRRGRRWWEQQQQERRTKREEECVSERVISWKQFTLKQQPEGEKKMLNTMTWTHERQIDREGTEGEGGVRLINPNRGKSSNINKTVRQRQAGRQGTHRRLGGCVQGLHLCVGHPHVTGRLQSGEKGSSEEMKKQGEGSVLAVVRGIS